MRVVTIIDLVPITIIDGSRGLHTAEVPVASSLDSGTLRSDGRSCATSWTSPTISLPVNGLLEYEKAKGATATIAQDRPSTTGQLLKAAEQAIGQARAEGGNRLILVEPPFAAAWALSPA
jgi:hypothetical protein